MSMSPLPHKYIHVRTYIHVARIKAKHNEAVLTCTYVGLLCGSSV